MLTASKTSYSLTTIARSKPALPTSHPGNDHTHLAFANLFDAAKSTVIQQGGVYVTALGTTRRKAGGVEKQRVIDVDLNAALAKKAKEDGADMVSICKLGTNG